eukprot:9499843-Pyramimonas_sp.AAC.1
MRWLWSSRALRLAGLDDLLGVPVAEVRVCGGGHLFATFLCLTAVLLVGRGLREVLGEGPGGHARNLGAQ